MNFMSNFQDISKSSNLFWLRIIFAYTLIYKKSDGASLMSVASLCLEFCMALWGLWNAKFNENRGNHEIHSPVAFLPRYRKFHSRALINYFLHAKSEPSDWHSGFVSIDTGASCQLTRLWSRRSLRRGAISKLIYMTRITFCSVRVMTRRAFKL